MSLGVLTFVQHGGAWAVASVILQGMLVAIIFGRWTPLGWRPWAGGLLAGGLAMRTFALAMQHADSYKRDVAESNLRSGPGALLDLPAPSTVPLAPTFPTATTSTAPSLTDGSWRAGPTENDPRTVTMLTDAKKHCRIAWLERDQDGAPGGTFYVYGQGCHV